jgi:hypothetical protein
MGSPPVPVEVPEPPAPVELEVVEEEVEPPDEVPVLLPVVVFVPEPTPLVVVSTVHPARQAAKTAREERNLSMSTLIPSSLSSRPGRPPEPPHPAARKDPAHLRRNEASGYSNFSKPPAFFAGGLGASPLPNGDRRFRYQPCTRPLSCSLVRTPMPK